MIILITCLHKMRLKFIQKSFNFWHVTSLIPFQELKIIGCCLISKHSLWMTPNSREDNFKHVRSENHIFYFYHTLLIYFSCQCLPAFWKFKILKKTTLLDFISSYLTSCYLNGNGQGRKIELV